MKQEQRKICMIFFILLMFTGSIFSQNMYVRMTTGTQTTYVINSVQKITFSAGDMIVHSNGGGTNNYAISEIRYVNFIDLVGVSEHDLSDAGAILVYPNPAEDILNVRLQNSGDNPLMAEIFSPDGKIVLSNLHHDSMSEVFQINIAALPQGIYILRIFNNQTSETIRFIKN